VCSTRKRSKWARLSWVREFCARIAIGPVIAAARKQAHPIVLLAPNQAVSDYRPQELWARKVRLERLLAKVRGGIAFNEHLTGDGATIFKHACKLGFEGIVSKHRERAYRSGPSKTWLKVKNPRSPAALRFADRER
jgi:hypothetical protein